MSAVSLLSKLRELGITLQLVNDKLKITGEESKLTPALIDELKNKKAEIIAFLQENVQKRLRYESIGIVEKKEYYRLSSPQKRLYILRQMNPDSTAYNMPEIIPLTAAYEKAKIHETFKELIKRHESLRTSFHMVNDMPVQKIHEHVEFEIEYYQVEVKVKVEKDRSSFLEATRGLTPLPLEPAARSPQPVTALISSFIRPFDLIRSPLLRVGLIELIHNPSALRVHPRHGTYNSQKGKGDKYLLLVDMPHIISDGVSRRILVEDFTALTGGKELSTLCLQYKDYVEWLNTPRQQAVVAKQETYWLHRFKGEIPVLNLPIDYSRPQIQSFEGSTVEFIISKEDARQLKELAVENDVTLYMVLMTIYDVFLYKVTGQQDLIVGTGTAGRRHHDLQDIMGIFVNTLVIRNYPIPRQSFEQFLKEVKKTTLEVFENQEYPFEELVEKIDPRKDTSRNPLFDTMLMLQNIEIPGNIPRTPAKDTAGTTTPTVMTIKDYDHEYTISKFDLTLSVREVNGELHCSFEYCTRLFKSGTIREFIKYIKEIAVTAAADPGQSIKEITRISSERKEAIIRQLNRELRQETADLIQPGETLQSKLKTSFKKFPGRVAIESGEQTVTFSELNHKTGKITRAIIEKGIPRATCVGILLEDRVELIAVMVGILGAGSVFVPLDASYPRRRLDAMIRTTGIRLMVTDSDNDDKWDEPTESIHLHRLYSSPEATSKISLAKFSYGWEDCIYIYFTSGTTGTPRAMMGKNQGLLHFINWEISTFGIDEGYRFSQFIAPVFDAFFRDVLVPLVTGGVICIPQPNETILQSSSLTRWVEHSRIELIHCVPGLFRLLVPGEHLDYGERESLLKIKYKELKYILLSGEQINPGDLAGWYEIFKDRIQLVNLWGTSETTLAKTYYFIRPKDINRQRIPVGKPLPGSRVVVLDENLELCDPLVKGQLYIKTPFRTLGYHNEPALNRERFIPDPFTNDARILLHKTGDQGRMLVDGTIDVTGRVDRQIKIRGIRVELEEIESVLSRHERVKEVVVQKRKISDTDELLCAYITIRVTGTRGSGATSEAEYRRYLTERLPAYMVPGKLIILEKMPRKPNGKVDDDALPDPLAAAPVFQKPRDAVEKKLLELWSDILKRGKEKISVTHSFFELGGNSLHIMTLIARLHREFDVRVKLGEIFNNPTLRGQANIIRAAAPVRYASIDPVEKREFYPQSSAQKRLFFLNQLDETGMTYHMNGITALPGEIDKQRCENAFRELIARHESMRTSFLMIAEEPVQRIHDQVEVKLEYYQVEVDVKVKQKEQDTRDRRQGTGERGQETGDRPGTYLSSGFIRPFDLSRAPLVRMGVVEICPQQHLLMFDMHHIISDGTSETILKEDFTRFYNNESPGMLRLQYKDFSAWQNGKTEKENFKHQEKYWLKEFEGEVPVLELPTDYPRPTEHSFAGDNVDFRIPAEAARAIKGVALRGGATLFMVLAAAFNILLFKLSGQEDFVIGTPAACRRHAELEKIIGMFVNTLALRSYPLGDLTFREFLADVKERTLKAFENQEYPFEELVDKLSVKRDMGRNPLFDVMFVLQNMETGLTSQEKETGYETSQPLQPGFPGDKGYENIDQTAKFDLSIMAVERAPQIFLSFQYCTKLFKKETVERYAIYYKKIAALLVKDPGIRISEIEIVSEEEKNRLLYEFNDTEGEYPKDKTIHQLFEEQVEQSPDRVALVGIINPKFEIRNPKQIQMSKIQNSKQEVTGRLAPMPELVSITYRELNQKSNQLAYILIEKGVHPDSIVGIMMERSVHMIIGILAILKAGGTYLPIDTDYPEERIKYMLKDSKVNILVNNSNFISESRTGRELFVLNFEHLNFEFVSNFDIPISDLKAANLAYIIYTSGSTGRPKGVMIQHRNVVRLVKNAGYIHYSLRDRLLPTGSTAFDISTFEIWGPLLNGVMLWLESKAVILNAGMLKDVLKKYDITILHLIPQLFNQMADQDMEIFGGLRYFLVGGDLVKPGAINRLRNTYPRLIVVHCYGPTENTTFSTTFQVDKDYDMRIPIGKPINNSSAYILDKYNHLQPVGVPGELCVGGDGTARGYLNNPELTAEKFDHDLWNYRLIKNYKSQNTNYKQITNYTVQNYKPKGIHASRQPCNHAIMQSCNQASMLSPHHPITPSPHSPIYRCGDLARWLTEGNIEFLGRADSQVKVRGYRVELGEVESQLSGYHGIKAVVVVSMGGEQGDNRLCAYFVPGADDAVSVSAIRDHLSAVLPPYMVPSYFVSLERMPMLVSGKIDRKALPMPDRSGIGTETLYEEPGTGLEETIAAIWKEVLKLDRVGVNDHFFSIGGNSFNILQVNTQLKKLNMREIPVARMFRYTTIRELARYLEGDQGEEGLAEEEVKLYQAIDKGKSKMRKRIDRRKRSTA
jgi:tyrocidine synthetase-3